MIDVCRLRCIQTVFSVKVPRAVSSTYPDRERYLQNARFRELRDGSERFGKLDQMAERRTGLEGARLVLSTLLRR